MKNLITILAFVFVSSVMFGQTMPEKGKLILQLITDNVLEESGGYLLGEPEWVGDSYGVIIQLKSFYDDELARMAVDDAIDYSDVVVDVHWRLGEDGEGLMKTIHVEDSPSYRISFFYFFDSNRVVVAISKIKTNE